MGERGDYQIILLSISVEERRIVYVGRLEKDLTKEGLRRKFNGYGTIKLVTMHEKSNG